MKRNWHDIENLILSAYACKSRETKGRQRVETKSDLRTDFQRDRDRIVHSKAFRRLKHKTQVFIIPEGDHYRTRLTHTLEVSQIARTIARGLALNEDLTEAIALGHDLGHTPFGHAGERVLNRIYPGGFRHNEQSLRVVDVLENGKGLNLTWEVRDGILKHTGAQIPETLEGQVVRMSDRIAYINHDIDDAIRGKILRGEILPKECLEVLGYTHSERIGRMVNDIIDNSEGQPLISMSAAFRQAMEELRSFMFEWVYVASEAKKEEEKAQRIVEQVYEYFLSHEERFRKQYYPDIVSDELERDVCDFVAGMTDRYIISLYKKIVVPEPWLII